MILIISFWIPLKIHADTTNLLFQETQYSRILPHAYIDQAKDSLPKLFPDFQVLYEKRSSKLIDATYSLIVYQENKDAKLLHIEGAVVKYPNAWIFKDKCFKENGIEKVVVVMEQIATLKK